MNTEIILHASEFANEKEFIQHEITRNLTGKLDTYLKKEVGSDDKVRVELGLVRDKKGISGKLDISFPGGSYRSSRENFEKLDDLINHLFSHIKDQMAE